MTTLAHKDTMMARGIQLRHSWPFFWSLNHNGFANFRAVGTTRRSRSQVLNITRTIHIGSVHLEHQILVILFNLLLRNVKQWLLLLVLLLLLLLLAILVTVVNVRERVLGRLVVARQRLQRRVPLVHWRLLTFFTTHHVLLHCRSQILVHHIVRHLLWRHLHDLHRSWFDRH